MLQHVWIAARSSLRAVFEQVSIQDLADGKLPEGVAATAAVVFVLWVAGIVWAVKQERLSRAAAADERELETASA